MRQYDAPASLSGSIASARAAYIAIVIFQGGDERLWLAFGALAGLGLENKHTTLFFGSAFFGAKASIEGRMTAMRSRGNPSHANPPREKMKTCAPKT